MLSSLTSADLDLCALTVARMATDQPDSVRASLAWVIRNRLAKAAARRKTARPVARACTDVLQEALGGAAPETQAPDFPDADWCRIYALNCLVWAGDIADPTAGATACHRHDRAPDWARGRKATALLGPYLFFR